MGKYCRDFTINTRTMLICQIYVECKYQRQVCSNKSIANSTKTPPKKPTKKQNKTKQNKTTIQKQITIRKRKTQNER